MKNVKKDYFSFYMNEILTQIKKDNYQPDVIIGLARGGLIPGVILSHKLNCRFVAINDVTFVPHFEGMNVLVVDDINDTGNTLETLQKYLDTTTKVYRYCVVVENEVSSFKDVSYFGTKINKEEDPSWIQFWWEYSL